MPTVAELLALPYEGSSPFARGLTAEDYRAQYREHGRPMRVWNPLEIPPGTTGPNGEPREAKGYCFVEQTKLLDGVTNLSGLPVAMFWGTNRTRPHQQFGYVSMHTTEVSVLPDEIELVPMARLCPADVTWKAEAVIVKSAGASDVLTHKPVAEIVRIVINGAVKSPATYEATSAGIHWLGSIPADGTKMSVTYRHYPMFECLGTERGLMQKGVDGLYLPQRYSVQFLQPHDKQMTY